MKAGIAWIFALVAAAAFAAEPHPRLFFKEAALAPVRTAVAVPGSHHAEAWARLRARVENGLAAYDGRPGYRASALAREAAFAWRLTREPAFAELAYRTLVASRAADEDQPDNGYGLSRAMMAVGYALAYDACHDAWTPAQRAEILGILRAAADAWPGFRHANVETPHRGSNWVGVTRGGELLQHLAARGDGDYGDRAERIALCVRDLAQHLETAYGPSGWTQEGPGYLEYTFGFLAPAVYAARAAGFAELGARFDAIAWHRLAAHTFSFRENHAQLQSGVAGPVSTDEGLASLIWPTVPAAERGAYRFFYDRHLGVKALRPTYDARRAGTVWAMLFYPADVPEAEPVARPLFDAAKGAYFFRNRWRDRDDVLVSLVTRADSHSHAWQQAETWQTAIMAFDTTFAGGPGKERGPEFFSKLLIDGRTERRVPEHGARELGAEAWAHGGGAVVSDAAANFGLTVAKRRFAVDFAPRDGVAAVIRIDDELAHATPFSPTWQWRPEAGVRLEVLPARDGVPAGFVMHGRNGWLRGWIVAPAGAEITATDRVAVTLPAQRDVRFRAVLALGQGTLPARPPGE